jgi:hypothetical protein
MHKALFQVRLALRFLVALAFITLALGMAQAQPAPASPPAPAPQGSSPASKAPPGIIEKARQKVQQRLSVLLDDTELSGRINQLRAQRNLKVDDDAILEEQVREVEMLREQVFPSGRMGPLRIARSFRHFPIVIVEVHDEAELLLLLSHPLVKSIDDANRPFYPATPQSMLPTDRSRRPG